MAVALSGFVVVVVLSLALSQTGGGREWKKEVEAEVVVGVSNGLEIRGPQERCSAIDAVV